MSESLFTGLYVTDTFSNKIYYCKDSIDLTNMLKAYADVSTGFVNAFIDDLIEPVVITVGYMEFKRFASDFIEDVIRTDYNSAEAYEDYIYNYLANKILEEIEDRGFYNNYGLIIYSEDNIEKFKKEIIKDFEKKLGDKIKRVQKQIAENKKQYYWGLDF